MKSIRANVIPDDGRGRHDNRPNKVSEEAKNKVNLLFLTDTTKSAHEYKLRSLYVADIILCLSSCFHACVSCRSESTSSLSRDRLLTTQGKTYHLGDTFQKICLRSECTICTSSYMSQQLWKETGRF